MEVLPKRKRIRLPEYDYNSSNVYFITVCTKNRESILSSISVGATIGRQPMIHLTRIGLLVEEGILNIPKIYPMVNIDNHTIMPNHIHLLLSIVGDNGRPMTAPTISRIMNQLKGYVSKKAGFPVWQKSFYEHILRSDREYREIWSYIDNNPSRWAEDRYFSIVSNQ